MTPFLCTALDGKKQIHMKHTIQKLMVSLLACAVTASGIAIPASAANNPSVQSNTTMNFTLGKGNDYQFKFTVSDTHANPNIARETALSYRPLMPKANRKWQGCLSGKSARHW
jgi:hypothetical protein